MKNIHRYFYLLWCWYTHAFHRMKICFDSGLFENSVEYDIDFISIVGHSNYKKMLPVAWRFA